MGHPTVLAWLKRIVQAFFRPLFGKTRFWFAKTLSFEFVSTLELWEIMLTSKVFDNFSTNLVAQSFLFEAVACARNAGAILVRELYNVFFCGMRWISFPPIGGPRPSTKNALERKEKPLLRRTDMDDIIPACPYRRPLAVNKNAQ